MESLELKYHRNVHKFYYLVVATCILIEIFIVRLKFSSSFEDGATLGVIYLLIASTLPLSILFRSYFILRPRIFSNIEVYENFFLILFKKQKRKFAFNQIKKVERSFLPMRFLGGFVLVFENGQKIRISSAMDNHLAFLKTIREYSHSLVSDKFMAKYEYDCQLLTHSWRRFTKKWETWYFVLAKYLVTPLVVSYIVLQVLNGSQEIKAAVIALQFTVLIVTVYLLALLCNSIEETFINFYYGKKIKNHQNIDINTKLEIQFNWLNNILFLILLIALGLGSNWISAR